MPGRPFIQYIKSPPWPDRSRWTESEFEAVERSMSSMWPVEWRDDDRQHHAAWNAGGEFPDVEGNCRHDHHRDPAINLQNFT